jgi:hypothetical protein
MPGYGALPPDQGSGLLPWPEAERRLTLAHDYWVATVRPDGSPQVMPVWGVWTDTTDDARNPVVVDGTAERVTDAGRIAGFVAAVNAKYRAGMTVEFQDPAINGTYAVRPVTVIALTDGDFTGSPTRWRFTE